MLLEEVTIGSLIDSALVELEAATERGIPVTLQSAISDSATTLSLSAGDLSVSDLVEFGPELMLVTAKTADTTPIYTVARGYHESTAQAQAAGAVGIKNPQFPRYRIQEAVKRSFTRLEALGVPVVRSTTDYRTTGSPQLALGDDVRRVLQVLTFDSQGRTLEVDGWRQFSSVPTALSTSGKMLQLPYQLTDDIELHVVYQSRYLWPDSPTEASVIEVPAGAEDLPSSYAAAWLISGREISRAEIDRSTEQSVQDQTRVQSGVGLMRSMWQAFYRALDEARRVVDLEVPKHRPFITRPTMYSRRYCP